MQPVVEPVFPTLPEFQCVRDQPIAAPVCRSRRMFAVLSCDIAKAGFEFTAVAYHPTLRRSDGCMTAAERALQEIFVGFLRRSFFDRTLDAHLPFKFRPME